MYCTKCGLELGEDACFCSRCGHRTEVRAVSQMPRPLMLDKRNKKVAGVCAGFARYFDVDVVLMRVLWLGISLCTGVGFLVYVTAWIVIPSDAHLQNREVVVYPPEADRRELV